MSDLPKESKPVKGASEIQADAAIWLERRQREDWSAADQAELDLWLAQSPAHVIAYLRVEDVWQRADRLQAIAHPAPEPARIERRWSRPIVFGLAAAIAVFAVLGGMALRFVAPADERTYSTDIGGRELVAFADGTQIELNTNTVLRARMTTKERIVWLDKGEAYFQVKHDAAHPFIVMTGNHRVTDLGTKFLIRSDPGRLEVALMEGRVRFGAVDTKAPVDSDLLMPGDQVIATANTVSVQKVSLRALAKELIWRRDMLIFDHTTLADAAREINRYNRRKLVVTDPAVAQLTIGGTFPKNDIGAITSAARELFKLRVEEHGDEIVISR